MKKANDMLVLDVEDELDWDPLIDDSQVIVTADDGVVTLSGSVLTYYESVVAQEDAFNVSGVTVVDNALNIGLVGDAIADADIAANCTAALNADSRVPYGGGTVIVLAGWVTLGGEVRRHFQRTSAEHAVRRVNGVLGVTDNITLTSEPIPSDITDQITRAFKRNALIGESLIDVSVVGHTVYLDGAVESWAMKDKAEDIAWDAPGVDEVVDRLNIAQ